jgi:hypothetical protein
VSDEEASQAPEYDVYGGSLSMQQHLVTRSSVDLGDWTAICGRLVDKARKAQRWELGAVYCDECEAKAGPTRREQEAREERPPWKYRPA